MLVLRPFTKSGKCVFIRILHEAEISRIDLSMAIEASEILIDSGRIEEYGETIGKRFRQAALILVENIQVVFETEKLCAWKRIGPDHACDDAPGLFL